MRKQPSIKSRIAQRLAAVLLSLVSLPVANAQTFDSNWPAEEPQIAGAVMFRTSIAVRSIEDSLRLYADILGMTPYYVRTGLTDERLPAFSGLEPGQTMNLTVLRTETDSAAKLLTGHLGLSEIRNSDGSLVERPAPTSPTTAYGTIALMLLVENTAEVHRKVVAAGFDVIAAPREKEGGGHTQLLMRGPDGERLWISESRFRTPFIAEVER
ncbi:MAG: VOC family protein [Pseudomonadota bacterium]